MAWKDMPGLKYQVSENAWKEATSFLARVGVTLSFENGWLIATNFQGKQRRSKNVYNIVVAGLQMPRAMTFDQAKIIPSTGSPKVDDYLDEVMKKA